MNSCFLFLGLNTLCWVLSLDTLVALQIIYTSQEAYESASQVLIVTWKWSLRGSQCSGNCLSVSTSAALLCLRSLHHLWGLEESLGMGSRPCSLRWVAVGNLSSCESLLSLVWRAGTITRRANSQRHVWGVQEAIDGLQAKGWFNYTWTSGRSPCPGQTGLQRPEGKTAESLCSISFWENRGLI